MNSSVSLNNQARLQRLQCLGEVMTTSRTYIMPPLGFHSRRRCTVYWCRHLGLFFKSETISPKHARLRILYTRRNKIPGLKVMLAHKIPISMVAIPQVNRRTEIRWLLYRHLHHLQPPTLLHPVATSTDLGFYNRRMTRRSEWPG